MQDWQEQIIKYDDMTTPITPIRLRPYERMKAEDAVRMHEYKSISEYIHALIKNDSLYVCPHCGYEMSAGEEEDVGDCGCPSCRRIIEW
jgi:rubrerythrin